MARQLLMLFVMAFSAMTAGQELGDPGVILLDLHEVAIE